MVPKIYLCLPSQRTLQQMALVFERLDTVVKHLLHSFELEAQPLQLGRVQLVRLLPVGVVQSAQQFQDTSGSFKEETVSSKKN
jgi:hypothetical protein